MSGPLYSQAMDISAPEAVGIRKLSVALICPRFEPSFFGMEYALPILPGEKRAASFGGALPLLAALAPAPHEVELFDENIEPLDFRRLAEFDVVGLTGMIVQRARMIEILERLRGTGPLLCVGGPYVTVDEGFFEDKCDVIFIGEADTTWPAFLADVEAGRLPGRRYEQTESTDLTTLPLPRYDLLKARHYLAANVQFSRGCPFLCEFCDIIVIFGRKPRQKAIHQILAELERLLNAGIRTVFFVDDNFIGNKAAAKLLLSALVDWQAARGHPITFSTEASINLADDAELLELMSAAGFASVFIGIESPRASSLLETRKVQNVRGDRLELKVDRIHKAGIIVQAGFILGFDADDESIFDEQFNFIQRTGIGAPFVSILSPIPSTPLWARLQQEGRLRLQHELIWFEPRGMSRETLARGYHRLNERLYDPDAFFRRIFERQIGSRRSGSRPTANHRGNFINSAKGIAEAIGIGWRLIVELARNGELMKLAPSYVRAARANRRLGAARLKSTELMRLFARHWHAHRVCKRGKSYWGRSGETDDAPARPDRPVMAPSLAQ